VVTSSKRRNSLIWLPLVGSFLFHSVASWAQPEDAEPLGPADTCRVLNTVEKEGRLYRHPFPPITPLEREGGQVVRSSCPALLRQVQNPGAEILADLPRYQEILNRFFSNYCHRDSTSGWRSDIRLRDTGPYVQYIIEGSWRGEEFGTHNAVVIWYSPEFVTFLEKRAAGDTDFVMPEGAMAVKEMYRPPSSDCKGENPIDFHPSDNGIAYIIRHSEMSLDGWYWAWYGWRAFAEEVTDLEDQSKVEAYFEALSINLAANQSWRPANGRPGAEKIGFGAGAGWGYYCLDCHASATSYQTFGDLKNITGGTPDNPINNYLSMNFPTAADPALSKHAIVEKSARQARPRPPAPQYNADFLLTFDPQGIFGAGAPNDNSVSHLPSASFDTVWVGASPESGRAQVHSQYLTSDQCIGCHDAGQTGVLFDMASIEKSRGHYVDQAPYGTWRTSPMGLAGRDPIFFAQLASETQTFHSSGDTPAIVENVCLGCHGIQGQRQYTLDHALANDGDCGDFTRTMVNQIPVANGDAPAGSHPNYGALARDGIACTSCHRAIFEEADIAAQFENGLPNAQNKCVIERQKFINPGLDHNSLAATFTGSYLVGGPDVIRGPFETPKEKPMRNSLGLTPKADAKFKTSSDLCGSCHTVHLPILHQGEIVGTVFEQTTYTEWAFSDFRTGETANYPQGLGQLPSGQPSVGKLRATCQQCHMESSKFAPHQDFPEGLLFPERDPDKQFVSKIATIQEKTNYPKTDNTLPAEEIDLERRQGFARHTLAGLNVFFMSMVKQFPHVLGLPGDAAAFMGQDPLGETTSLPYIDRTLQQMQANAENRTATVSILSAEVDDGALRSQVRVVNGVAHKFPSGVGFRRAFVEFRVLDENGNTLWGSGVTNGAGVILDNGHQPDSASPIAGELWWDEECQPVSDRLAFQPHFDSGERAIRRQDQAQIYQELVMMPPQEYSIRPEVPGQENVKNQPVDMCGTQLAYGDDKSALYPGWSLTTSFLSICAQAKDNRLLPQGFLVYEDRLAASRLFTTAPGETPGPEAEHMAVMLAKENGSWGVGDDPDYRSLDGLPYGGNDTFAYEIPLNDIAGQPHTVTASLHYQAIPPFYLQDRFCTATGKDRDRLFYLAGKLNLDEVAKDWKLTIDSARANVGGVN
jgi:hypothetical protein